VTEQYLHLLKFYSSAATNHILQLLKVLWYRPGRT